MFLRVARGARISTNIFIYIMFKVHFLTYFVDIERSFVVNEFKNSLDCEMEI